MVRGSSVAKRAREDTLKSKKINEAFREISKYFSQTQWEKMNYSDKIICMYLKRNYATMFSLGLSVTRPTFMRTHRKGAPIHDDDSDEASNHGARDYLRKETQKLLKMSKKPAKKSNNPKTVAGAPGKEQAKKAQCTPGKASTSGKKRSKISGFRKTKVSIWSHRLRKQKNIMVYEEISDPEEEKD